MCIKPSSSSIKRATTSTPLNPNAQAWKPTVQHHHHHQPPFYPHLYFGPHHQKLPCHFLITYDAYTRNHPVYHQSSVVASTPVVNPCNEVEIIKRPKCPPLTVKKHGGRRGLPPRMRGAVRSFHLGEKQTPKMEWKPKKLSYSDGDDGVTVTKDVYNTKTTVMIKNIPNHLRSDFMLKFLDQYCKDHSLEYDFFYIPMDFSKLDNLGYAFVNFTTAAAALKFKNVLQDFKWETVKTERGSFTSKKICEITWARIQGRESLVKRFQQSNFLCDQLDFLPMLLDPPRNGLDPNPSPPVTLGSLRRPHRPASRKNY